MVVSTDLLLPPTEGDQLHIDPLYVLYLKQVRPVHLFKRYCIKFLSFFSTLVELKFNNIEKKHCYILVDSLQKATCLQCLFITTSSSISLVLMLHMSTFPEWKLQCINLFKFY